jgi:uncharacterized membrane protein YfcA
MLFDTTLLIVAALVAGALNAMAGGGSFLTLPALVLTGIPAVSANATGTLALLPGYIAGGWGFRADTRPPPGLSAPRLGLLRLLGGSTGAVLLLLTPDATFRRVAPRLLLLTTYSTSNNMRRLRSKRKRRLAPIEPSARSRRNHSLKLLNHSRLDEDTRQLGFDRYVEDRGECLPP